jgi:hypothetical protein
VAVSVTVRNRFEIQRLGADNQSSVSVTDAGGARLLTRDRWKAWPVYFLGRRVVFYGAAITGASSSFSFSKGERTDLTTIGD